jgi:hypothetical protein
MACPWPGGIALFSADVVLVERALLAVRKASPATARASALTTNVGR